LVNDGSTDNTAAVLDRLAAEIPDRITVLHLADNSGKAEAVRAGMNMAGQKDVEVIGYLDADFATPAEEMLRLVEFFKATAGTEVLLGSRWMHLGADIERNQLRHYGGRLFATLASQVLNLKVYDTQCGAKLFKCNDALLASLDTPFVSPWAFDVELIGRLRQQLPEAAFLEVPLNRWVDVRGSKITLLDMIRATFSLFAVGRALKARRQN
jgi:glycosyltransferase involved in cell wall biosynthesis